MVDQVWRADLHLEAASLSHITLTDEELEAYWSQFPADRPVGANRYYRMTRGGLKGIDYAVRRAGRFPPPAAPAELVVEPLEPAKLVARVRPGEELWVIARSADTSIAEPIDNRPGSGALVTVLPGQETQIPVPLEHTEVIASVAGYIASVNVKQTFSNPFDTKIEAVYVFPLPENAAVNGFVMTIGDRTIRAVIRERKEAEEIYLAARAQGHVASLLSQDRPNIFTQKVANIEPGKSIDIDITYFHTLTYSDGWFEYTFPMVVGPRFNPSTTLAKGEGVAAMPRGVLGTSGQATEIQYLRPHERSGHDIGLTLSLDAGLVIEEIVSVAHQITVDEETDNRWVITLDERDSIPNRDFVLRYRVAGDEIKSGLIVQPDADGRGGYFTFMMVPPMDLAAYERTPIELVFVLDCSGSMSGAPIAQAKDAMRTALRRLQPGDTFQVIRFSNNASALGPRPLLATPENIQKALAYVDGLSGSGGTQMIEGIKAALDFPRDKKRIRYVAFLTDGYIGNEAEILDAMEDRLRGARVFSFGVGSSVNRYLMDSMARLGRGAVAYVGLDEDAGAVMDLFIDRIAASPMTDIEIDFGPLRGVEAYPKRSQDLFVGKPVVVTGRYESGFDTLEVIEVHGTVSGSKRDMLIPVRRDEVIAGNTGLGAVWARAKITELSDQATTADWDRTTRARGRDIEKLALEHNLVSAFTSFVAVDSLSITQGSGGTTVPMPVNMPEGVRYETTVAGPGG